jgi:glycine/D-amino acid oxidase-like deaminating enzyme
LVASAAVIAFQPLKERPVMKTRTPNWVLESEKNGEHMSVYSGPSLYAMAKREREQLADYEEAREAFEQMLEQDQSSVALWMENGGVVDHQQTVAALVKARHIPEVRALLNMWGHEYARFCV